MLAMALVSVQDLPALTVPSGWGVNIHFTDERPGEVAKIANAFRLVRMDFAWGAIEREKGKYDFVAYDRLLAALKRNGVRPYLILDYGNDLYGEGAPRTPEARAAFCRWVAAAMARYRGRGVIWEMWNEPNIGFWRPKPNVGEYIALAKEVGETVRQVAPQETLVGPATSGFDWAFLERCLDAGLLKYWDAVSVHPYRQAEPETVEADWLRLRAMIDRASPGRQVPMVSGEWGYSELYSGQSKERQGEYLVRSYLVNLRCGVPISIWYDWKDDGTDPKETEHHFGTVGPDLAMKPAFDDAWFWVEKLAGYAFVTRLETGDPHQWALMFRKGNDVQVVYWTTGGPSYAKIAGESFSFGENPALVSGGYLVGLLALKPLPWAVVSRTRIDEVPEDRRTVQKLRWGAAAQATHVVAARPLRLRVEPNRVGPGATALLQDPFGRSEREGFLAYSDANPISPRIAFGPHPPFPVRMGLPIGGATKVCAEVGGERLTLPVPRFVPLSLVGATATSDGDAKVRAVVSAKLTPDGTRLDYDFDRGWRFAEVHPAEGRVEGRPSAYGMWVLGDGSGDLLRMRYVDSAGQAFQPEFGPVEWRGWRYVSLPLDGSGGHWGGANDGVVRWPIRIGTVALVERPGGVGGKGSITVARPVLAYRR